LLVFAAFWATFAPAWAASPAFVDDAPRACARAENSHLGFFGDLAKTHRENSAQVAKPHQEAESAGWKTASAGIVGSNADPASLHKYNYGSSNPVMFSDPTGNYSLGELQIVTGVIGNLARIAIPSIVNRFAGTIAFNIFRGMFAAEKALLWLEVGTAVVGGSLFVAEGVDAMAENLLRNSQPVSDGPFPESTGRGNLVERIANPNLGGNVNIIDDLTDGIGTSVKSRGLSGGESAYLKQILADVQDVAKAPTSRIRGTTANGRRVDLLPGAVRQPALLVGVPQNHSRMLLSPTFRAALESYRRNYGVVIRVVPVGGWTKR
jgi:hypothetical protein